MTSWRAMLPGARAPAHDVSDGEARERGGDSDEQDLESATRRPAHRDSGLEPADQEQRGAAYDEGREDPPQDVVPRDEERRVRDQGADHRGEPDERRALARLGVAHGREPQLVGHHQVEPRLRLGRDFSDHLVEFLAAKVPPLEDLADLLSLDVRELDDLASLPFDLREVVIPAGDCGRVRDGAHGDRFRERRREAPGEDDRDRVRGLRRGDGDPENHAEDVHEPVLAAEDEVREEPGLRVLLRESVLVDLPPEREPRGHGMISSWAPEKRRRISWFALPTSPPCPRWEKKVFPSPHDGP